MYSYKKSVKKDKMSSDRHYLDEALWKAVFHRDQSDVLELLRKGANPSSIHNGSPVLTDAVREGSLGIVQLLCEHGGNPNSEDDLGNNLLFFSTSMESDGTILKYLLEKGAGIYHRNIFGQTSLFGILQTPISTDVLKYLTKYIDKSVVDQRGNKGETLAHMIDHIHTTTEEIPNEAKHEHEGNKQTGDMCVKLLQTLFDNGLDMDIQDSKGNTPLMVACIIPCYSSLKFLLKATKTIFNRNKKGETAIHTIATQAGAQNFEKCLELLLENGFEINATDILGLTPLHYYVSCSDVSAEWIQFYIDKGAKIEQTTVLVKTFYIR